VETLARDCVTLPEWVERDFEQEQTSEDFCWAFGPAAAEAAAAAAAAVAGLAEPGMLDDAQLVMSVLEAFALDLDCLTAYIYGGLCRTDKESGGNPDDSWERITRSGPRDWKSQWPLHSLAESGGGHGFIPVRARNARASSANQSALSHLWPLPW
ncbi:unnamed protein product, partial [Effrenium voratum]